MKILITGATGFIGFEVASQLSKLGLNPRLLVRRAQRSALLSRLKAEIVQGDLNSSKSLNRATKGVDTVIHLAARATFENYKYLKKTNIDGSLKLMEASIKSGVKNFIFTSSMLVYNSQENFIDLNTPANPVIDYGKAKVETELKLSRLAEKENINFCSIRLPHIYGPQDLLFGQIKNGTFFLPGDGNNYYSHLHVEDASALLIKAAEMNLKGIYPVSDYDPVNWNYFFKVLKEYYEPTKVIKIPIWLGLTGLLINRPFQYIFNKPTIYTTDTIKAFNLNLKIAPNVLWDDLKLKPKYESIDVGIPATLDSYVAYRWKSPIFDK